jgi:6-phosphofructokinase 1
VKTPAGRAWTRVTAAAWISARVSDHRKFPAGTQEKDKKEEVLVLQDEKLDAFGHVRLGGIGKVLAQEIEKRTGFEARFVILGYVQRGGTPTAFDRMLATRFGVAAADLVNNRDWGKMVALKGNTIVTVPLAEAVVTLKGVPPELFEVAETFFG